MLKQYDYIQKAGVSLLRNRGVSLHRNAGVTLERSSGVSFNGISNYAHMAFWAEQDADIRGRDFWTKTESNYHGWNYDSNPIFGNSNNTQFDHDFGYLKTNNGIVNPKWWEYTLFLGYPLGAGELAIYLANMNKGR